MTPQEWERLQGLFEEAVSLPPEQRERFLAKLDSSSAEALRSLLESDDRGPSPIEEAIAGVAASSTAQAESSWTGRQVGSYRIMREIGRGGMGVVFEGQRSDPQFRQRVAIKIAIHASLSPALRERFRHERQMLAQLEHPNIARLLDGGETEGGLPYFAMEFIEGLPIAQYCHENRLGIRQRIELYLQVCSAVDYAHQNLIVHRDIKPANILVDRSGVPKLLDFGVAKLLDAALPTNGGATQTAFAPMTPDYCSPEQLRNQRITTRTDVYLLGLLLFELLTGQKAQVADTSSPLALEQSICESEPPLASATAAKLAYPAFAQELRGDLETIIAKACRKDPEARFATVADLALELRRHLAGEPIESRPASFWYRSGKFVRRNRLAIAGAATVAVVLVGGIVSTTYQARRAARRFEQVRSIARTLTGEIHAAIQPLPGSVAAQELVVKTGLRYLDGLSKEAAGDPELLIELAEGYTRIAAIQGADTLPSKNDRAEARRSLDRTERILDELLRNNPTSEQIVSIIVESRVTRAEMQNRSGEPDAALRLLTATEGIIAPLALKPGATAALIRRLGLVRLTLTRDFGDRPDAAEMAKRLLETVALLEPHAAHNRAIEGEVAVGYSVAGGALLRAGNRDEAAPCLEKAAEINRRIVEQDPHDANVHRSLMLALSKVAELYAAPGPMQDTAKARDYYRKVAAEGEWLYQAGPSAKANRVDYAMSSIRSADGFPAPDAQGMAYLTRGLRLLEQESQRDPKDGVIRRNLTDARIRLAARFAAEQNWVPAMASLEQATKEAADLLAQQPESPTLRSLGIRSNMELGKLHAQRGNTAGVQRSILQVDRLATPQFAPRITAWKAELGRAR